MQSETYIKTAGEEGEGTILVQMIPFPEEIPGGKQYMADYVKANFKDPPDTFGPPAYVAGEVLIELIKRHGPHRQAIMGGLRKITPETPFETIYGKIWFDPAGELRPKPVGLIELKGGEWTPYKPKK